MELLLQLTIEVDQEVTTGDQMELGEGRIAQHAMNRKDDAIPDLGGDSIMIAFGAEVSRQPGLRYIGRDRGGVNALARRSQGSLVDIRPENHQVAMHVAPADFLAEENRECVGLLTGGAARHPDTNRLTRLRVLDQG